VRLRAAVAHVSDSQAPAVRPRDIAAFFEGSIRHQIFKAKKTPSK